MTTTHENEGWASWLALLRPGRAACAFVKDFEQAAREIEDFALANSPAIFIVQLDWEELPRLDDELGRTVASLEQAVQRVWPSLYGITSQEASREEVLAAGRARASVMSPILRRIVGACSRGERLRLERYPLADRVRQLVLALSPERLFLVLRARSGRANRDRTLAFARGAEWLAEQSGVSVIALLPQELKEQGGLDPIAYGAFHEPLPLTRGDDLEAVRLEVEPCSDASPVIEVQRETSPHLALGTLLGRPHPGSDAEKLLFERLRKDPELRDLFAYNRPIRTASGRNPTVDVISYEHRLVIEIDGDDHQRRKKFVDDRRRDVELILHGYTVARFSDFDVLCDTDITLQRIRELLHFMKEKREVIS